MPWPYPVIGIPPNLPIAEGGAPQPDILKVSFTKRKYWLPIKGLTTAL